MSIRSLFAYIITIILILFSLIVSSGKSLNIWSYFDPSVFINLIGASIFTLVNFKISDILGIFKNATLKSHKS